MTALLLDDIFLSGMLVAGGLYVLTHVTMLARGLQRIYVLACEDKQRRNGWGRSLFIYNPHYWQRPFAWFMFKGGIVILGIWLLVVATVPIGSYFSPIHPFGATIYIGEPYGG